MDIKVNDKYFIRTDEQNVTLFIIGIAGEKSKEPGKTTERPIGYFPNLEQAAKSCLNHDIQSSELSGVNEIVKAIKKAEHEICKAIEKAGLQKII